MSRLLACLFVLAAASVLDAASLEEARLRWLKGNYAEAEDSQAVDKRLHELEAVVGLEGHGGG